jgi:hypothetical protein
VWSIVDRLSSSAFADHVLTEMLTSRLQGGVLT